MKEKRRWNDSLRFTHERIGESTLKGTEVSAYDRSYAVECRARVESLEWTITEMQRIAREAEK